MRNNSGNNIQVALRKRPLSSKEIEHGKGAEIVQIINDKQINLLDPDEVSREYYLNHNVNKNRFKETHFTFDAIFDEKATNHDLYEGIGQVLLKDLLEGYNTTIFAYGATGAGKTYTMIGQRDAPGFIDMMLEGLFDRAQQKQQTHDIKIRLAYMEIYNENLKDLLSADQKNLDLREDPKSDVTQVHGLTEVEVTDPQQISGVIRFGNRNRSKDSTVTNEASSRSHAIVQIQVECTDRGEGLEKEMVVSKLSLVDLAGSERAWANKSKANKLEGAKINQSLLTLGNCIQALSEMNDKGPGKNNFVPFRGSKLTRLLKDSLGGNCRTVMIANISGSIICFEDTYNTLLYASRAKSIKLHIQKNVIQTSNHVSNYAAIIEKLNKENDNLRQIINGERVNPTRGSYGSGSQPPQAQIDPHQAHQQEQLEQLIKSHFDDEAGCLRTISENQLKLDKLTRINSTYHAEIRRMTAANENASNLKEQLMVNSQGMVVISNQIADLNNKYMGLQESRKQISFRIKSSQLPQRIQQILFNQYSIRELGSENIERELSFKTHNALIREKESEISSLSDQLQVRDKILQQQKQLLEKSEVPFQKQQPQNIRDANLIIASINASPQYASQQSQQQQSIQSSQNYSVDSDPPQFSMNRKPSNRNSSLPKAPNRSSQERGARLPLKNNKSYNDIRALGVRPTRVRNLLSAKSHEALPNMIVNQSPPNRGLGAGPGSSKAIKYPYLHAKKQKVFQLGNIGSPLRMEAAKKSKQSPGGQDDSLLNITVSDHNLSPTSKAQHKHTQSHYANLKNNNNRNNNSGNAYSDYNLDAFDLASRKSLNLTPQVKKRNQRSFSKNSQSSVQLPSVNSRKNILEFNVHKSPYVQSFKNPEVAAQTRKNKLMQLNLNLDHLKDIYTQKYFSNQ